MKNLVIFFSVCVFSATDGSVSGKKWVKNALEMGQLKSIRNGTRKGLVAA